MILANGGAPMNDDVRKMRLRRLADDGRVNLP